MSRSSVQQNRKQPHWWTRPCQRIWQGLLFIWATVVLGIALNVGATWLTTKGFDPARTPLGWLLQHLPETIACGSVLLALTVVVGILGRQDIPSDMHRLLALPTEQSRRALIYLLQREYRRQIAESLQGAAMMTLALQQRTNMTRSSVSLVSWRMNTPGDDSLHAPLSIVEAYDDAGSGLLLLGAPGAGKSTLLRELASELLTRAEDDAVQPVPVIMNLSSWAIKKLPLGSWLVEQLQLVYAIPHHLSQTWIEQGQFVLLLDGLDEMEFSARTDCIEMINAYKEQHFVPIVVCSRSQEYVTQQARLRLPGAVEVRPLTADQVDAYLKGAGKPLAAVRTMLKGNSILRDLVKTPLMLSVVMLAYRGKTVKDLPQLGSTEEQQRQVFDQYVLRMLESQSRQWHYAAHKTQEWLTWLAQQMKQRHLTEFYLERLQPTWLSKNSAQFTYKVLFGPIGGLVAGLAIGLATGQAAGQVYEPSSGLVGGHSFGLIVGLVAGLVIGLVGGLEGRLPIQPSEKLTWSWNSFLEGLISGFVGGLICVLVGEQVIRLVNVLVGVVTGVVTGGLVVGLAGSLMRRSRTQPSEKIGWSWKHLVPSYLIFGVTGGLGGILIFGLFVGLAGGLLGGLLGGVTVGLVTGLSRTQVDEHSHLKPNQGIQASGWNALRGGLISGLGVGLGVGLLNGLINGPVNGLVNGLVIGLFFGPIVGLVRGGLAYIQHYSLRFLLWQSGVMPWHYVRFLEEATERILLQRVGGGYRFIHPLFLDYFASLGSTGLSSYAQSPSSRLP